MSFTWKLGISYQRQTFIPYKRGLYRVCGIVVFSAGFVFLFVIITTTLGVRRHLEPIDVSRAAQMLEIGSSQRHVADVFDVSQSVLARLWSRYQKLGVAQDVKCMAVSSVKYLQKSGHWAFEIATALLQGSVVSSKLPLDVEYWTRQFVIDRMQDLLQLVPYWHHNTGYRNFNMQKNTFNGEWMIADEFYSQTKAGFTCHNVIDVLECGNVEERGLLCTV